MVSKFLKSISQIFSAASSAASAAHVLMESRHHLKPERLARLDRFNHRGETVSLISGPVLAAAATGTAVLTTDNCRLAVAAGVAGVGAGLAGFYDDMVGSRPEQSTDKGFKGHLAALKAGRVSSGIVKIAAIGGSGLLAGMALYRKPVDVFLTAGVVAGMANFLNLLDLRPGRALKAGVLIATPQFFGPGRSVASATMGASVALLPDDLQERTMLGDAGANALGALLGVSVAANTGRVGRSALLAGLIGLTALSEKVSFTKVIAKTPVLRELDALGRRPVGNETIPTAN